ncbi:MAG: hypothetical protein DMG51_18260 [Acidobacteria bacterium]|nr:MAG: hypothetical protein DMG51_18260 [Acidobacteriota bacterium]
MKTIGRWSLVALIFSTMIGASILGLTALIAARLGRWSPIGFLAAFVGIAIIAACMSEGASQFREAGPVRQSGVRTISCDLEWLVDVAEAFRLPHGVLIAGRALLFTGVLVTRMHLGELILISITAALAFVNCLWARKQVTLSQVAR